MTHRPTRTRGAFAAVLTAGLVLLSACSGGDPGSSSDEPVAGGTLNVLRRNPFEGFELDKESLNATFQISQAVLEPLLRSSADGTEIAPGVADTWTYNDDSTVLTLGLDPKAAFSDGSPVTPEDVAFSVKTWQAGVNYGAAYAVIDKVETVDEHTVAFHLKYPDTTLPALLTWAAAGVMPKDFGGRSAAEFWDKPIGAGPFAVTKWSAEGEVALTKNEHYHEKGRPYLDGVVSRYAADPNSVGLQLQSGEADLADELYPVTAAALPKDDIVKAAPHITPILLLNTATEQLGDEHVRRAIGMAIDYDGLLKSAFKGFGEKPSGALPPNSAHWAAPSKPYFSQDVAAAKAELAQAKSVPDSIKLDYPNDAASSLMAQVIQANLKDIGLKVTLKASDPGNNYATVSSGAHQMSIFSYNAISPDVSDPAVYVAVTKGIFNAYDGGEIFGLIGEYAATTDDAVKTAKITAVQDALAEDVPFIALGHNPALLGSTSKVHGVDLLPWGAYYLDGIWKN